MSTISRLIQAREDLSAARAARAHHESRRIEARALEAEQERPQDRMRYAMLAVQMRMAVNSADNEISALQTEIAELEATHAASLQPVVLTAEQMLAVDDTAGLEP